MSVGLVVTVFTFDDDDKGLDYSMWDSIPVPTPVTPTNRRWRIANIMAVKKGSEDDHTPR